METESRKITGEIEISETGLKEIRSIKSVFSHQEKIKKHLDAPVTELIEIILGGTVQLGGSDVHIEPEEDDVKIRIRIDGVLQEVLAIDAQAYKRILSRIKLLSKLKLNISDRPQDGRFSIVFDKTKIEIRASSLPAERGEAFVLRILDPRSLIGLETLGLRKDLLEIVEKEIKKPYGMIVVTGPTGSGKTTTLYAFCKKIKSPKIKIITIEDPIEYHLDGISQTQVSAKKQLQIEGRTETRAYDFASGLKSIMRQDPDVILVGEIRDEETVNTALQAALTGHLVLTTLHTNDAAGAVARLISLGGKLANIGPAINMIIAQRLARKVCSECCKMVKPSPEELVKIKKQLNPLGIKIADDLKIPKANGCSACNNTGYKGRIGMFEILLMGEDTERFILKESSIAALKELAIKNGMTVIKQDGFLKVIGGVTTIEEIERVMGE